MWELVGHLEGTLPDDHPFKRVRLQPEVETAPHFINPQGGDAVARRYRQEFTSRKEAEARVVVCVFVICAETDGRALRSRRADGPDDHRRLRSRLRSYELLAEAF